jgi:hypothetical protein
VAAPFPAPTRRARETGGADGRPALTLANMETTAAFRLSGNATLTAAAVTRRLAIQPTRAFEAGDPVSSRSPATRQESLWLLTSSPGIETGTEIAEHLHRLLSVLEPATAALWELAHAGYDANWLCRIASHATEHAAELDRQTMQRVLALPGDLWLDVHGDETDH